MRVRAESGLGHGREGSADDVVEEGGMGVECVEDLHDVEPEDCIALGMSHIQQNRLRKELAKLET